MNHNIDESAFNNIVNAFVIGTTNYYVNEDNVVQKDVIKNIICNNPFVYVEFLSGEIIPLNRCFRDNVHANAYVKKSDSTGCNKKDNKKALDEFKKSIKEKGRNISEENINRAYAKTYWKDTEHFHPRDNEKVYVTFIGVNDGVPYIDEAVYANGEYRWVKKVDDTDKPESYYKVSVKITHWISVGDFNKLWKTFSIPVCRETIAFNKKHADVKELFEDAPVNKPIYLRYFIEKNDKRYIGVETGMFVNDKIIWTDECPGPFEDTDHPVVIAWSLPPVETQSII